MHAEIAVRPLTPAQLAAAAQVERACLAPSWSEDELRAELAAPGRDGRSAWRGDTLVGFALWMCAGDDAELLRLAVVPAHRRRGVATVLVRALCDTLVQQGARAVFLEVRAHNEPAIALYRQTGFACIDRRARYYKDGEDALIFARELP